MLDLERRHGEKARPRPLITTQPLISSEDLSAASPDSPELRRWYGVMHERGHLNLYVQGLQKAGVVQTPAEALAYSGEVLAQNRKDNGVVYYSDLVGHGVNAAIRKTRSLLREQESSDEGEGKAYGLYGLHGTTSHYAIRDLMQRKLPRYEKWHTGESKLNWGSQSQFSGHGEERDSLWDEQTYLPGRQYADAILPGNRIADRLLGDIATTRESIVGALSENNLWLAASETRALYDMLYPIFGDYASRLVKQKGNLAKELLIPTFLNWATAVLTMRGEEGMNDAHVFFTEMPVICGPLRGGRVDALEVSTITGRTPTGRENQILARMAKERHGSVGTLIRDIRTHVGDQFELDVWEYKFDIGDNKRKRDSAITPADLQSGPIPDDERQVQRYITLGTLDGYMNSSQFNPENWAPDSHITYGNLVYMIHSQPREVRFPISLSLDEQQEVFRHEVASLHTKGKQNAADRQLTTLLFGHVNNLLEGKKKKSGVPTSSLYRGGNGMSPLPTDETFVTPEAGLQALIDRYKVYVDRTGSLIELAGKNARGKDLYRVDATRLLKAIGDGSLEVGNFDPKSGGKIKCLMPDHTEDTPSMQVYLKTETFICFGCGVHGRLDNIPDDVQVDIRRKRNPRTKDQHTEIEVGEEQFQMMGDLQRILQKSFKGSRAERYIREDRKLDPQKAYELGAGYGRLGTIVREMLKNGWTMEQLLSYGVISKGKKGDIYADLDNRITFPLEQSPGKIDNFYGRALGEVDKRARHRKLKTGIPHGIFNAQVLDGTFSEVIMVEGVMDALSLIQMGIENVVAVIGTKNTNTLALLAASGKDIGLALDNDETGKKVTEDVKDVLKKELGAIGNVRNFTQDITEQFPDFAAYKDFNAYWQSFH